MEELLSLEGADMDLRLLSQSFSTGPVRVEKREERHFLILESEASRQDADLLAAGTEALNQMNAIMLAGGSNFRPPRVRGITKQMADGTLRTFLNAALHIESRSALFVNVRLIGPDGKELVENKGPTEDQVTLQLAAKDEHLRRALLIYGTLKHDWVNLYKTLEAIEDGNGGEKGLIAKNFVPGKDIKNFKDTANSWRAIELEARHATTKIGSPEPKITLAQAQEMFRKLFQSWIQELKDRGNP